MTAAFVHEAETFPEAEVPKLQVLEREFGPCVNADGSAEVWLWEPNVTEEEESLIVPLRFPTIALAERAEKILIAALREVKELANRPRPFDCAHREERAVLLARTLRKHRFCVDCGTELGTLVRDNNTRTWVPEAA